jgi:hypothetical protein
MHEQPDGSNNAQNGEQYGNPANEAPTRRRESRAIAFISVELAIADPPRPECR